MRIKILQKAGSQLFANCQRIIENKDTMLPEILHFYDLIERYKNIKKDYNDQSKKLNTEFKIIESFMKDEKLFMKFNETCGIGTSKNIKLGIAFDREQVEYIAWSTIRYSDDLEQLLNEIQIMQVAQHPNIVKFYLHTLQSPNIINIITKYYKDGTLEDYKKNNTITNEIKKKFIQQLISALKHLHSFNILHRDIKPANILIEDGNFFLADFGSATKYHKSKRRTSVSTGTESLKPHFTPLYVDIEMLKSDHYDFHVDIYSFGLTVLYLCSSENTQPYQEAKTFPELMRIKLNPPTMYVNLANSPFKEFINRCCFEDRLSTFTEVEELFNKLFP